MAVDFGIDVVIFDDTALQAEIDKIFACLEKNGVTLQTDIKKPGLSALIATLVRGIEKGLIAPYEPIIALIRIVLDAIDAGITAPIVFINKIKDFGTSIAELTGGLDAIIEFIVSKILEPISENINIPFPGVSGIIEILLGKNIADIDWDEWIEQGKIVIPQNLKDAGEEAINQALTLFKSFNGLPPAILNILELLLFPLKFAIGAITGLLEKVSGLISNIFDAIAELLQIISNPVAWVIDFIAGIFADTLLPIVEFLSPIPIGDSIEEFKKALTELVIGIFSGSLNLEDWLSNLPTPLDAIFGSLIGFVKVLNCFLSWFVSILTPTTILSLFGLPSSAAEFSVPPIKATSWNALSKSFIMDTEENNEEKINNENLKKIFSIGNLIRITANNKVRESIIVDIVNNEIFIEDELFEENVIDSFEIENL